MVATRGWRELKWRRAGAPPPVRLSRGGRLDVRDSVATFALACVLAVARTQLCYAAEGELHWAYRPTVKTSPPQGNTPSEGVSNIDRFIVAALEQAGLTLAAPAEKAALLRRATFDLTGLPPTWEEVETFVNDSSTDAFAKVVDRLLSSPRYGERWGRHWLDIARYADTHGGGAIGFTKFAFSYTYRDYVVRSFNADLPYNRFILEQLAADQLGLGENDPALAGLGFLTVGRQFRTLHDRIDDRIDVVTRGLLGLTVACARCHDHKFDDIPTDDYYALYAVFASSERPDELPVIDLPENAADYAEYERELGRRKLRYAEMAREQTEIMRNRLRMQVGLYLREIAQGTPEQDTSDKFLSYRTDDLRPVVLERWRSYLAEISADDPVFGIWKKLASESVDNFPATVDALVQQMEQENGDISELAFHNLATAPPRWNPRVLAAMKSKSPESMAEVAQAYGTLFASVQREWLEAVLSATMEAAADGEIIPDQAPRRESLNSAVNRQLRFHLYGLNSPTALADSEAVHLLNRPIHDHTRGLRGAIHELNLTAPGSPPRAMTLVENPEAGPFRVLERGDPLDRGAEVQPKFLSVLSGDDSTPFPPGQRRLGLARAIVDEANPLTRRVIVNWLWQHHFGQGLVATPDDWGVQSEAPLHLELLDYLANALVEEHWSLKQIHRRIMLSKVYQQAAVENSAARSQDPQNRLFWRMPRRRLEVEALRDAVLFVAGRLDETRGGRPFDLFSEPFIPRRSIYGFVNRDIVAGLFSTFDMADPNVCVARRPKTMAPQQALYALNSRFIHEQAQHFASVEPAAAARSSAERITTLFRRAFSRSPTAEEVEEGQAYLANLDADDPQIGWQRLAHALLAANEFTYLD